MQFHVTDLQNGYVDIVRAVAERGERVAPRGQATREVLGATIVLEDPSRALPLGVGRKLNPAIAAAEAAQVIGGVSYPQLMLDIAGNFGMFRDGGVFHGAYGPRLRGQLPFIVKRLSADSDTRQAVVTIWDPAADAFTEELRDYPCTVALQWMVRDGRLDAHTFMRSNDVWWGLAYDAFMFTRLQLTIAEALGLPAGRYFHHANSLHVYERDLDAVELLAPRPHAELENDTWHVGGIRGSDGSGFSGAMGTARALFKGFDRASDPTVHWYAKTLARYL